MLALCAAWLAAAAAAVPCAPFVEERAGSASFRPHVDAFQHCEIEEDTYRRVMADWLRRRPPDAAEIASISLGRAVAYPWISHHLVEAALADPGWPAASIRPSERDRHAARYVADPGLRQRLARPFEGSAYRVERVGHEKLLFGPADRHTPVRTTTLVPFETYRQQYLSTERLGV